MSWLIDPATRVLTGALDGLAIREQAIASNLANVDTPGYRAQSIDFESELAAAMASTGVTGMNPPTAGPTAAAGPQRTSPLHLVGTGTGLGTAAGIGGTTSVPQGVQTRVDGNSVDVDSDMTALAETQLKYAAVSRMLTGKLAMLKDVVVK